jgi:3-deoxy-7-phosphoheptulonate synthase
MSPIIDKPCTDTLRTADLRIRDIQELATPEQLAYEYPCTEPAAATVAAARRGAQDILHGRDDRLIVIIGPCSIHDPVAALEYAHRLAAQRERHRGQLELIMRVYFEKARTTVGWKGLINDPNLDGSFQINRGLRVARGLLRDINELGLPAACEFLDMIIPQYMADFVAWGAIGARTTESQVHRELASGLSCPIGFKNGTDGNVQIAIDAVRAASHPHHFLAVTKQGRSGIAATTGNADCHVVLRGGAHGPNYDAASIDAVSLQLLGAGLAPRIMIDVSHGNSSKRPERQPLIVADIAQRIAAGERRVAGLMVESHLQAGRQDLVAGEPLRYGQSITDGCIDWEASLGVLGLLAAAVEERRARERAAAAGSHSTS